METKLPFLTDKDEALIKYMMARNDFHNYKNNTHFIIEDYTTFSYKLWGMSEEAIKEEELAFLDSDFFKNMQAYEGAYDALECLHPEFAVAVVTSSEPGTEHYTYSTFERLFAVHHFDSIHHMGFEGVKWRKCKQLGGKILFDDHYGHLLPAAENGIHGILPTRPWNQSIIELHPLVTRVENWHEAVDVALNIKKLILSF